MNKVIKWIVVIVIAITVIVLIFGGKEEQTSDSTENTADSIENTTVDSTENATADSTESTADSMDVEQSEPSEADDGVSESTTDLLKAYEDNEVKENRVQKEHAQSQWRGNDEK